MTTSSDTQIPQQPPEPDYWVQGNEQWPEADNWESRPFGGICVYCKNSSLRYVERHGLLFKRRQIVCVFCGATHPKQLFD